MMQYNGPSGPFLFAIAFGMAYRIAQAALIVLGILFIVAPTHSTGAVGTAAALGTLLGFVVRLVIICLCFWSAARMGRKAKANSQISN